MQTASLGPGSESVSQLAGVVQLLVPAPPSQLIVQLELAARNRAAAGGASASNSAAASAAVAEKAALPLDEPLTSPLLEAQLSHDAPANATGGAKTTGSGSLSASWRAAQTPRRLSRRRRSGSAHGPSGSPVSG